MMLIPFDPTISLDQIFSVLIPENITLSIRLTWSERAEKWRMSIEGSENTIQGLTVVPNYPLLMSHKTLSPIDGDIIVLPLITNPSTVLTYKNLGVEWGLFWINADTLSVWETKYGIES